MPARSTRELRTLSPDISLAGLGGPQFAAAGGQLIADYRGLAVTGLTEAVARCRSRLRPSGGWSTHARRERPDALVVIDFPDFNFPLARRIRKLGIPVVYYIAPQIWAWRAGRLKTIREIADRVLVIFPFEEPIYREAGVPVEFVGHPLVDLTLPRQAPTALLRRLGFDAAAPTVALLPGQPTERSRANSARSRARPRTSSVRACPGAQFLVARAPNLDDHLFDVARRLPLSSRSSKGRPMPCSRRRTWR